VLIDVRTKQDFERGHIPGAKHTLSHEGAKEHGEKATGSQLESDVAPRQPSCGWPSPLGEANIEAVQNRSTQSQDPSVLFIVYDADGIDRSSHVATFISQNFRPGEVRALQKNCPIQFMPSF
jgi:rhodanese-related sulfurtransferase